MKKFIAFGILIATVALTATARKLAVDFINTNNHTCVIYLDNQYLGKMDKGEILNTELKKGTHSLSFVVFDNNGEYYTYIRDVEVNNEHKKFLLLADDSGYVHLEKYQGVNPLVLEAISHLPIITKQKEDFIHLDLRTIKFELYRYALIEQHIANHRITSQQLIDLLSHIDNKELKTDIAHMAYQHIIDKHNYHNVLFDLDVNSAKKLEKHAAVVNRYL